MSSFARFCALRHLNLDLLRAYQIPGGNAESSGSHLFDGRTAIRIQSLDILSAFTGVGLSMEPVHGNSQSFMGFFRNGTVGHSAGLKPGNNGVHTFHFFNRNSFLRIVKVKLTS